MGSLYAGAYREKMKIRGILPGREWTITPTLNPRTLNPLAKADGFVLKPAEELAASCPQPYP
jgi:hypothetical protein